MESADLSFEGISMSLNILKHCPVHFAKEVDVWLERHPHPHIDRKKAVPSDDRRPINYSSNNRTLSATYHTAHSAPLFFSNNYIPATSPPSLGIKGESPSFLTLSDSGSYFNTQARPARVRLISIAPVSRSRGGSLPRFIELWIIVFNVF